MIIDFRYHVASLVAIFIALALGILIGSTLVGQDFLENLAEEQKIWITKLEQDYLNLKKETDSIRFELVEKTNQLAFYQNFTTKIKPYLINGKLFNKKFAIIELDQNGLSQEVINILEQSGAKVISNTRFSFTEGIVASYDLNLLLEQASQLILNGEKTNLTDLMEETEIIKSIGIYGEILDGIIIVSSFNKQEKILLDSQNYLTNYLKDKIPIYLISDETIVSGKNTAEFSIINKIETIPGQVNLVLSIFENMSL